jgi:hypothetical protein
MRCWIVIALLAGCNGAPSCDDVASGLAHLARRSLREKLVEPIAAACERDAWPAEARRCLRWVEHRSRIRTCNSELSEKQTEWLTKQLDPDEFDDLRMPEPPPPPLPEPVPHPGLTIDVESDGTATFGGRPINATDLEELFRTSAGMDLETKVVIRSASGAPHGAVVHVMEAAKTAGLHDLAISTK